MKRKNKNKITPKFKNLISPFTSTKNHKIIAAILILFSIYLFIAFFSYAYVWKADESIVSGKNILDILINKNINNSIGGVGAYLSHLFIKSLFGICAILIPLTLLLAGLRIIGFKRYSLAKFIFNSLIAIIIVPVSIYHFFKLNIISGEIGIYLQKNLNLLIGEIGTSLLLLTILILLLINIFDINEQNLYSFFKKIKKNNKKTTNEDLNIEKTNNISEINTQDIKSEENTKEIFEKNEHQEKELTVTKENDKLDLEVSEIRNEESLTKNEIERKLNELGEFDPTLELSQFKLPKIDLLNDYGNNKIEINKDELEENKNKIVETLGHYKIGITSITATVGPTITLYEIVPEAGIRISKIKNLEDDISLSLAAEGIRIIAPIPGKGTIGIEVPNKTRNTVSMLEVLQSEKFQNCDLELPVAFGKTIANETYILDLAKMPHLLMAGATGQGKSVGLNAILASLLYKKHPSQIKFVLVDPKKVELTLYNKIERHYLAKLPDSEEAIITDTKKVVNTVNSLCIEMDERYELCKIANCRNIKEYNKKFISRKLNPNNGHRYLPYIVLVIDEFADLIMTAGKEIETPIARLAQLARAIGIHLIVATQRPSVNVITGIIKANFPARVAFRVTSSIDSRTIMDTKGAEQLIGMGDMLISTGNDLTRLQCAFIDTPEVEKICDFIGSQRGYANAHNLPEYVGDSESSAAQVDLDDKDSMFNEAALIVVQHQSGSTSLIQRKLRLGYNRAGRIIDQLEAAGIVGPFEGSKARKVLIKDEVSLEEQLKDI